MFLEQSPDASIPSFVDDQSSAKPSVPCPLKDDGSSIALRCAVRSHKCTVPSSENVAAICRSPILRARIRLTHPSCEIEID
ncbi:hypothetical protein BLOT_005742 [Blomia tropicalis]|nr:hypothetical protein BLOT_005742 [Blomia tropicalis]